MNENITITLTRGQAVDVAIALSLAAIDAYQNNCPISGEIYSDIRQLFDRVLEGTKEQ